MAVASQLCKLGWNEKWRRGNVYVYIYISRLKVRNRQVYVKGLFVLVDISDIVLLQRS